MLVRGAQKTSLNWAGKSLRQRAALGCKRIPTDATKPGEPARFPFELN